MKLHGHYADDILAAVVAREELSILDVQILADQVIAHTAGAPGLAFNASQAPTTNLPPWRENTDVNRPTEAILIGCIEEASTPAVSTLSTISPQSLLGL